MKVIGLIGGMSWESSAEYYRLINRAIRDRLGPLRSAEILMFSVDFGPIERAQHEGRWDEMGEMLAAAARCGASGDLRGIVPRDHPRGLPRRMLHLK